MMQIAAAGHAAYNTVQYSSTISSVERTWHMLNLIGRSILHGQLIVLPCVTLEFNPEVPIRYPETILT